MYFLSIDNDEVFLRVVDSNRKLDRGEIKTLEYNKNIQHFEEEIVHDFDMNDLDVEILEEYRQKLDYEGSPLELLKNKHLVVKKVRNTYLRIRRFDYLLKTQKSISLLRL